MVPALSGGFLRLQDPEVGLLERSLGVLHYPQQAGLLGQDIGQGVSTFRYGDCLDDWLWREDLSRFRG